MDVRENLNNPDILPYDYVVLLCQWYIEDGGLGTFKVVKEIAKSFNFNSTVENFSDIVASQFGFIFSIQVKFKDFEKHVNEPWLFSMYNDYNPLYATGYWKNEAYINTNNNKLLLHLFDTSSGNFGSLFGTTVNLIITGKRFKNAG